MIDIIIRDCDHGEWLPIIKATDSGEELYRGRRWTDPDLAFALTKEIWDESRTENIVEFKQRNGL
jgi:hypothetical protein